MVKVHKGLFCELAIETGFLNRSTMVEALKIQYELSKKQQHTRIGTICAENGFMTVAQVIEILEMQNVFLYECSACGRNYNIAFANPRLNYYCLRDDEKLTQVQSENARTVKVDGIIHFSMGFPGGFKPDSRQAISKAQTVQTPRSESSTNGLTKTKFNVKQAQLDSERLKKPVQTLPVQDEKKASRRERVQLDAKILAALDKGEKNANMRKVTMSKKVAEKEFEVKPDKVDSAQITAYRLLKTEPKIAEENEILIETEYKIVEQADLDESAQSELDISELVNKAVNRVERQLESLESEELDSDVFDIDTEIGDKLVAEEDIESDRMILIESVQSEIDVPVIETEDVEVEAPEIESEEEIEETIEEEIEEVDDSEEAAESEEIEEIDESLDLDEALKEIVDAQEIEEEKPNAEESQELNDEELFEFDIDMIKEKAGLDAVDEEKEIEEQEEQSHLKQTMGEILEDDLIEKIRETQKSERANEDELIEDNVLNDSDILSDDEDLSEIKEAVQQIEEAITDESMNESEFEDLEAQIDQALEGAEQDSEFSEADLDEKGLDEINVADLLNADYTPPETEETEFTISSKDAADLEDIDMKNGHIPPLDHDTLLEIKHNAKTIDDPGTETKEALSDEIDTTESDDEVSEDDDELPSIDKAEETNAEIVSDGEDDTVESQIRISDRFKKFTSDGGMFSRSSKNKKSPFDQDFDPPSEYDPETETMELYPGDEKDLLKNGSEVSAETDEALKRLKSIEEEDLESEFESEATDLREILKSASSELFFREENDYEDIEFDIDALDEMLNGDLQEDEFGFVTKEDETKSILHKVLLDDSELEKTDVIVLPDRFNMNKNSELGPPDIPFEDYNPDVVLPKSPFGDLSDKLKDYWKTCFTEDDEQASEDKSNDE